MLIIPQAILWRKVWVDFKIALDKDTPLCYLVKELKAMTEKSSVSIRFREQAAVGVLCGGYAKEHSRAANQKADCHTGPSPFLGKRICGGSAR